MSMKVERLVQEPGRHCKRILKINGDMRIGGVAIGCGDDVNQQEEREAHCKTTSGPFDGMGRQAH